MKKPQDVSPPERPQRQPYQRPSLERQGAWGYATGGSLGITPLFRNPAFSEFGKDPR